MYFALENWNDDQLIKNWNVKGQCFSQSMGSTPLGNTGIYIAQLLQLPNPETYTSHTFRRSGATISADNGASLLELMRNFRWKSETVARGYVDNSKTAKQQQAVRISGLPTPSALNPGPILPVPKQGSIENQTISRGQGLLMLSDCSVSFVNCTFNS